MTRLTVLDCELWTGYSFIIYFADSTTMDVSSDVLSYNAAYSYTIDFNRPMCKIMLYEYIFHSVHEQYEYIQSCCNAVDVKHNETGGLKILQSHFSWFRTLQRCQLKQSNRRHRVLISLTLIKETPLSPAGSQDSYLNKKYLNINELTGLIGQ